MNQVQQQVLNGMGNYSSGVKHQEDESWEVRGFAADTGSTMGTTWPPRSYACSFCRREFRSAQALGGHMNVHRRDRARLQQQPRAAETSAASPPAPVVVSSSSGGLCLFYSMAGVRGQYVFPRGSTAEYCSPSISPYQTAMALLGKVGMVRDIDRDAGSDSSSGTAGGDGGLDKELDLDLRLGC